jgi:hypothetical protein
MVALADLAELVERLMAFDRLAKAFGEAGRMPGDGPR